MIQERKILTIEFTAIILLWALVIIFPLLFTSENTRDWRAIQLMWAECSVVGFAFVINRFLFMPYLFFKGRYAKYIISITFLFLFLSLFIIYFDGVNNILKLFGADSVDFVAPMMGSGGPAPMPGDFHGHGAMPPGAPGGMPGGGAPGGMPSHSVPHIGRAPIASVIPPMITVLIFSAFVIALDIGLSIAVKWIISEQKQAEINKVRVSEQLARLQSQVSPHFFMNTLNNIHALVDIDSSRAKKTIIELSSLMDYLLYESSNKEQVSLQRELEFLESYISLMRLRYPKRVLIDFTYDQPEAYVRIPPLLFLNFIENSFKYGVDYDQESFIKINFNVDDSHVEMTTINSNYSSNVTSARHGLGISNSRKRLALLYGDRYKLEYGDKDKVYFVTLKIPFL